LLKKNEKTVLFAMLIITFWILFSQNFYPLRINALQAQIFFLNNLSKDNIFMMKSNAKRGQNTVNLSTVD